MTQDTKVKIWAIVASSITSSIIMVASFSLNANRDDNKIFNQKLEQKVDKEQYKQDCTDMDERVKRMENTYDLLIEIRNNQAEQKTDIEWIKKTLDKKQK